MTQRLVPGAGKSAMVSGLPSGPMTYLVRGRSGSLINDLTHSTANQAECTGSALKICLSSPRSGRIAAASEPERLPPANGQDDGVGGVEKAWHSRDLLGNGRSVSH